MTNKNSHYRNYIDLLKDKTFVRWRIAPSEEITDYWENIIDNNPKLKIEILKADNYLRKHFSDDNQLTDKDKAKLLNDINVSILRKDKKNTSLFKLLPYVAAACILLFIAGGLIVQYINKAGHNPKTTLVEGCTQALEDIRLITGSTISTFERNIEIKVDNGIALIDEGNQREKEIEIRDETTINKLIIPYGKRSSITLSDGTKIHINSGSVLEFPSKFSESKREIKVIGEIFAEITPDKKRPFYVHTCDLSVQVYGTKFNVSSNPEEAPNVVLVEGSVKLISGNKSIYLNPNEKGELNTQTGFSKKTVNPQEYITWKEGYLTLNKMPIADVLQKIGRFYNVKFNLDKNLAILGIRCSGKLDLSDNLDDVMNAIAIISQTNYVRNGNIIYINKRTK